MRMASLPMLNVVDYVNAIASMATHSNATTTVDNFVSIDSLATHDPPLPPVTNKTNGTK